MTIGQISLLAGLILSAMNSRIFLFKHRNSLVGYIFKVSLVCSNLLSSVRIGLPLCLVYILLWITGYTSVLRSYQTVKQDTCGGKNEHDNEITHIIFSKTSITSHFLSLPLKI